MANKRYGRGRNGGNGPTDYGYIKTALERLVTGVVMNVLNEHDYAGVDHCFATSFSKRMASALLTDNYVDVYRKIVFDKVPVPKPCTSNVSECKVGGACISIKKVMNA